ncbi:MAG: alanine racemase [Phenylobacterium sp.]|uniref:alanine racemase n=1 Tax=Phenylobacterium sp. TaxID=1871053 RepID=UPI002A35A3A5|nr:alanine racemase [Phenylobacterium sp.]MDX9998245.1 alanine racemase [Phenylobacterium sp.]
MTAAEAAERPAAGGAASARARLTIDLDALAANYRTLREVAAGVEVAAVVKSDGYGLGAAQVARRLRREGARSFFVARLEEGEALRTALGDQGADIYVLDGMVVGAGRRLAAARLIPVLNTVPQVEAAVAFAAGSGAPLPCALHIDTGMNRQGLAVEEACAIAAAPGRLARLDVGLVMSHLGSAHDPSDPRNGEQLARFSAVRPLFPEARASFANSGGTFLGPEYRFDMVRPGVSLYGGGPEERPDPAIATVVRLEAPVLDIRRVAAGEHLGYGSGLVLQSPTRVALLGAGYTDGIIRAARQQGYAWLAGARRRLLAVTMDLTIVEAGDAPVQVGEMAELLGPNVLLDDLAQAAGTVAHEVLVRLSPRAERIYLGG